MLRAVVEAAPHRWYPIGLELGYTVGQVKTAVSGLIEDADKMQMIVDQKAMAVDSKEVACQLLQACRTISPPIIEEVQRRLRDLQSQ